MKDAIKEYKENECKKCIHKGDTAFQDCSICECIDGTAKCVKYENKEG